jgi:hypothetical protein
MVTCAELSAGLRAAANAAKRAAALRRMTLLSQYEDGEISNCIAWE